MFYVTDKTNIPQQIGKIFDIENYKLIINEVKTIFSRGVYKIRIQSLVLVQNNLWLNLYNFYSNVQKKMY